MKLTPPKKSTFWISVVLAALGLVGALVTIPVLSALSFWLVLVGYLVLAAGLLLKGF